MRRGHLNGSCEVGYSATLARAQGHNFKGYLHWGKVLAVEGSEGAFLRAVPVLCTKLVQDHAQPA